MRSSDLAVHGLCEHPFCKELDVSALRLSPSMQALVELEFALTDHPSALLVGEPGVGKNRLPAHVDALAAKETLDALF